MSICEISDFSVNPQGYGGKLHPFDFKVAAGDIWCVDTDRRDTMQTFMRSLATLEYPDTGSYLFSGVELDFSCYRKLLDIKKKIGYVYPRSALIRNITVRENLALKKSYEENRYNPVMDENTIRFSKQMGIEHLFNERPDNLGIHDFRKTILVREFSKMPTLFLAECPEEYTGYLEMGLLERRIQRFISAGNAFVFFSDDETFIKRVVAKRVKIRNGRVIPETTFGETGKRQGYDTQI